ncbi:DNA-deoxyinosine glycosylase [Petralouisia muris]|jgi:hypoxanthine-DNA glycosylase|uniref:DNA-deoxyinosine glycosylase n=1 Tax=Petralouisia muris TaxID=3032872 RepID=A0AC61RVV7_9FIRM|nr:DNA-deoxyinosine glycosylase [Petralouisia muris]TGY95994.1 DNA-deoxyinosine glycosylase [Petralouisia muris]
MPEYQRLTHEFEPVFQKDSRILILGTFPSVKSREQHFYYGHPQNRFWKVLAAITGEPIPGSVPEKKHLLLSHRIAVWDVILSCDIIGSSDSSIRNVIPADIPGLLKETSIQAVFGNGNKACELYEKYTAPMLTASSPLPAGSFRQKQQKFTDAPPMDISRHAAIRRLPSTSPANAAWTLERLTEYWKQATEPYL